MSRIPVLTAAEMRAAEAAAIAAGTPALELMERAGAAVAAAISARWTRRPVAVVCGPGNNGGDGFVVARRLKDAGWLVRIALVGERERLAGAAEANARRWTGSVEPYTDVIDGAGVVVDALFGTGLARDLVGEAAAAVAAMNRAPAPKVAVDIASGVDADTGAVRGSAVRAALTVAFAAKKPGHLLFPGRAFAGEVETADIGVPVPATAAIAENAPALWRDQAPRPDWRTHKYRRGHAAVLSGPRLRTGAARLAARAALRVGAGLVTVFTPPDAAAENAAQLTAVMLREVPDAAGFARALADDPRFTAALLGPGAGVGAQTASAALAVLETGARAVLDADALTSFADAPARLFAALRASDLLTPHDGEFLRLFSDLEPSVHGRLAASRAAAARCGAVVLLKGPDTVVAAPDGRAVINVNADANLATAGSGDVLAGLAAGLVAQGMPTFEAAAAAVWLHGAAGSATGPGLIAEDIEKALPQILSGLRT